MTPTVAFTFDPATVVQLLIAFILPILVGLVTTRVTSPAVKAWLLAGLSLVTSLLVELGRGPLSRHVAPSSLGSSSFEPFYAT